MRDLIQHFLDLSEPPMWRDLCQALMGAAALFIAPVLFVLWAVALGAK